MHTSTQCPLRSMAWITVNKKENQIIETSKDMNRLLGYDPTHTAINTVWTELETDQSYLVVSTLQSKRTLCVCKHDDNDNDILICSDITDINHIYHKQQQYQPNIAITRLTMYGTIDAAFLSQEFAPCSTTEWIGQPMMRFIHSDDVKVFCGGLKKASQQASSLCTLKLRLLVDEDTIQWTEFTVVTIEGGRQLLCLMRPLSSHEITPQKIQPIQSQNCFLTESVNHLQRHFWRALDCGMTLLASNLASSMMSMVQSILDTWYLCHTSSWDSLSGYLLRRVVQSTKERPELDRVCYWLSWTGLSESRTRSWVDQTLDQTTDWLLSKRTNDTLV
ncbi:hypothetical protein BDB01DRAFT_727288 [Pilobolus umbonatus]|nr:hypothetical protein BDB01DRAFT_727288 [Pilobolus umbonatus]